jgi:hypothetical protein
MTMRRREFLSLSAAGAAGLGVSLLGAGQARAAATPLDAPSQTFAVGVRQYNWTRGSRPCTTFVYYPATGSAGGSPVTNAPVANGVFPVYNFTHGYQSSPQNSLFIIQALAAAGFVVPAPYFNHNFTDVYNGNESKDVSQILTNTLALNTSGPLAGHIDTGIGVGVSGHSLGGMITDGLLTSWPDSRIISANPQSTSDMGTPSDSVKAKVLFVHGDHDTTVAYSGGRQAYSEMPPPKAFLTFIGGTHTSFWSDPRFPRTVVDWARWSMYDDNAAFNRLPSDASGSNIKWEFVGDGGTTPPTTTYVVFRNAATGLYIDGKGLTTNGATVGQYGDTGSANQQWTVESAGSYVRIRNRATGLYVDGAGAASNGSAAEQWGDTNSDNQQWSQVATGSNIRFRNRATGLFLDGMGRTGAGADLGQYGDSGSANQQWTAIAV